MTKIKISQIFTISLVTVISLYSITAITKEVGANQTDTTVNNQATINETQANINANQENINRNQAEINKNQTNINDNQNNSSQNQANNSQLTGATHRSRVATFVQGLLNVASRTPSGIGEQVRTVAQPRMIAKTV